jgi:hypothetical protein
LLFLEDVVNRATVQNVASMIHFSATSSEFDSSATHGTEKGAEQYERLKLISKSQK